MSESPPPSPTGSSDSECPICFYPFEENDYYDVDCCGKRIHIACLEGWKQKQGLRRPTCPCCRSEKLDVLEMGFPENNVDVAVPSGMRDPILSLVEREPTTADADEVCFSDVCCRVFVSGALLLATVYFIMASV